MRSAGIHYSNIYERHETGEGHPESADRYRVLKQMLERFPDCYVRLPGRRALLSEIRLAHDPFYQELVRLEVASGRSSLSTGDTAISRESHDVALEATGAVLEAVDHVMSGKLKRVFCAVRPPGHHASASGGMGFCIFNHVAIAARYLQARHGLRRVAILDWDVHHGNGTEEIFIDDPTVFYASLHQANLYPFTGAHWNRGRGAGLGANLNLPLPAGSDGSLALRAWDEELGPAVVSFNPEFILISAGFDARIGDPLGGLCWDDETFAEMTRRSVALADQCCGGKLVSSLEGGYDPAGLAKAAFAHVTALA